MTDNTADEDGLNVIELTQDASIQVTCLNPDRKIKFPFGVVTADNPLKDNRERTSSRLRFQEPFCDGNR